MNEYQTVQGLLSDANMERDLYDWGFTNQVIHVQDRSQTVYTGKGQLFLVTLPEGKVVLKKQENVGIEAKNLQRKKRYFPSNYPQVYSINSGVLLLEFIEGPSVWERVECGEPISLEFMVTHIADIHDLGKRQLAAGEIDFKLKGYADYCGSKFGRHLAGILEFGFEKAYSDLKREVETKLNSYNPVEHVDANLRNWVGSAKIDETNDTLSVPHLTLKSMLEYGPLNLDKPELDKLYRLYCDRASCDFDNFMEFNIYADVIFHLNKVCREVRSLEKGKIENDANKAKELRRHTIILREALEGLLSSGHDVSGLLQLNDSITAHSRRRGWL